MEMFTWILGGIATVLNAFGYVMYNKMATSGGVKPHFATWFIWLFMDFLNLAMILHATSLAQALQYMVGLFLLISTLLIAIWKGGITWPKWKDSFAFLICPMVISALLIKDPLVISIAFLIGFAMSFYPTFLGVYADPVSEHPLAWYMWSAALVISVLNGVLSWNGDVIGVLNPVMLFVCNASIIWLCSPWMKRALINTLRRARIVLGVRVFLRRAFG